MESEARGKAHVHVVIIGFGAFDVPQKTIFEYETPKSEAHAIAAKNINPYLVDAPDLVINTRRKPLNADLPMSYGSMMIDKDREEGDDGDGLILTREHRDALLAESPQLAPFIRVIYGGKEYINGTLRWCLWLADAPPALLRERALLRARIEGVKKFREGSDREQTRELAKTPSLFGEIRQPDQTYLLFPKVSSETRRYIPIGFVTPDIIASGSALIVPGATFFHFGVLCSAIHNAWMRRVAGRMKSDYQYSAAIVYNNYPWPESVSEKQRAAVEAAAQKVLAVRAEFLAPAVAAVCDRRIEEPKAPKRRSQTAATTAPKTATLADLYDPLTTPPALQQAHEELDRAVDKCYRPEPFTSERQRVEFLFALYEKLTAPLVVAAKTKRSRKKSAYAARPPAPSHPSLTPEQAQADAAHHFIVGKEEPPPYHTD